MRIGFRAGRSLMRGQTRDISPLYIAHSKNKNLLKTNMLQQFHHVTLKPQKVMSHNIISNPAERDKWGGSRIGVRAQRAALGVADPSESAVVLLLTH